MCGVPETREQGPTVHGNLRVFYSTFSAPEACFLLRVIWGLAPAICQEVRDHAPLSRETGLPLFLQHEFRGGFPITSSGQSEGDKRLLSLCLGTDGASRQQELGVVS